MPAGGRARPPISRLTADQKEDLIHTVVRLNGGKGSAAMTAEVSRELTELDMGDWPSDMQDAADFLSKRNYDADPTVLQILRSPSLAHARNFWLLKAASLFPKLTFAANKLLSAHVTTAAAERNWSAWGRTYTSLRANLSLESAEKMIYVKANMPKEWYS